jgi:hypothetical protein
MRCSKLTFSYDENACVQTRDENGNIEIEISEDIFQAISSCIY